MPTSTISDPPKIVVLDGFTLNPGDLSWMRLQSMGKTSIFDHTPVDEIVARAGEAQIILANKVRLGADILKSLPQLKCICVTATGYNNIDLEATKQAGITVCNVSGYGAEAVSQHVFAMILALTNRVFEHHQSVMSGKWAECRDFSYTLSSIRELAGKTLGIYGFGQIGQRVGEIGRAFGMKVIAHHKHPRRDARPWVRFVDIEALFRESDFLTLHAPLTNENRGIVNREHLKMMPPHAILINTGRGGLVNEQDLKDALLKDSIAGAALDVLSQEPPPKKHPLIGLKNCLITPHIAWATLEARQRLLDATLDNIKAFLEGRPQNIVSR